MKTPLRGDRHLLRKQAKINPKTETMKYEWKDFELFPGMVAQYKDGTIMAVNGALLYRDRLEMMHSDDKWWVADKCFQPVPITPETLGMLEGENGETWEMEGSDNSRPGYAFNLGHLRNISLWYNQRFNAFGFKGYTITYLHQLQQTVFALTGIQLKLKQ